MIPSAQAEILKNFFTSIFREDDARSTPTLRVPTVVMPVSQSSIPVVHREPSSLDISKRAGPDENYHLDMLTNSLLYIYVSSGPFWPPFYHYQSESIETHTGPI